MTDGNAQLRAEIRSRFEPPIDVLLDPSLLASKTSLERLSDSRTFASQAQATLGQSPTKPRIGELQVPATFRELVENEDQAAIQRTRGWEYYCGQAKTANREAVIKILDQNDVSRYSTEFAGDELRLDEALGDSASTGRLPSILEEEYSFLRSGGIVLSRTSEFVETLRDATVPTIDLGKAKLNAGIQQTLGDLGYGDPARICAFSVSAEASITNILAGEVLSEHTDAFLYRIGS